MAKDPAFLFYPGDFNTGTQFFTDEQVGKYVRLLMAQHQHGHLSENQVLIICKSYDKDVMNKFVKDKDGLWFNERLESEIVKRKEYSVSRSKNRTSKSNISKTHVEHVENENRNKDINELNNKSEFKVFDDWIGWGKLIVDGNDQHWEQMRGRVISQSEMDSFLSVATRNEWKMDTQAAFRISLKGFKSSEANKTGNGVNQKDRIKGILNSK